MCPIFFNVMCADSISRIFNFIGKIYLFKSHSWQKPHDSSFQFFLGGGMYRDFISRIFNFIGKIYLFK